MNNTNIIPNEFKSRVIGFKNTKKRVLLNLKKKMMAQYELNFKDVKIKYVMRIANKEKARLLCIFGFGKDNRQYDLSIN